MGHRKSMKSGKLAAEFLASADVLPEYFELVARQLRGEEIPGLAKELPEHFQILLHARVQVRAGKGDFVVPQLDALRAAGDSVVAAEASLVLGNYYYTRMDYALARDRFENAVRLFSESNLRARKLLSEFNRAQCLIHLGRREEAYAIEARVHEEAELFGLQNIQALGLRSLAFQNLRRREFERSLELFRKAETIFMDLRNHSDASVCCLYSTLISLGLGEEVSLESLKVKYPEWPSARAKAFYAVIVALLSSEKEGLSERLAECEQDFRQAFEMLGLQGVKSLKQKGRARLSDQLLGFLREKSGATAEECVAHLWPGDKNYLSLEKRLWTLIYRINQKRKVIFLAADGRYQVL